VIGGLAARVGHGARVTLHDSAVPCVESADFVFLSIRVAGMEARAHDEAACLEAGVLGQETVGPAGFAMAVRTIPHARIYARLIAEHAPRAWIVNFTNPVGVVTQAMAAERGSHTIGICDTPTELFEDVAHALGVPSAECHFDYAGLNHLGWLREVLHLGRPVLGRLWDDDEALRRVYRGAFFSPSYLRGIALLPTEYVYYYLHAAEALAHTRTARTTRGAEILRLNAALFDALSRAGTGATQAYEDYLAARNAGYMQIESGAAAPLPRSPWAALTGYDKIAWQVVHAIHFRTNAVIPLNVLNRGTVDGLAPDDVVEVPCVVNGNGALPLHVGALPGSCRELVASVKHYERLTLAAAATGRRDDLRAALASHPLMRGREHTTDALLDRLWLSGFPGSPASGTPA
jgi:6-phospho-beta-glucosidase